MNVYVLLIAIAVIVLVMMTCKSIKEGFHVRGYPKYFNYRYLDDYYWSPYTHTDYPFWNYQLGRRRNMSYDLRGDVPIPYAGWSPFLMSSGVPIRNKPLWKIT